MRSVILAVCLLSSLLLSGCKNRADPTGKWTGTISSSNPADANNPMAQMAAKMLGSMTLELKSDHTFSLMMMVPIEGTWTQSDTAVTLTTTKVMGMDMAAAKQAAAAKGQDTSKADQPMVFTMSGDGNSMSVQDPNGKGTLTFKRDTGK